MTDINEYAVLFYKEERVVGVTSMSSTIDQVRGFTALMANSEGNYLPNNGDYNLVGFMKTQDINEILPKALDDYDKRKND